MQTIYIIYNLENDISKFTKADSFSVYSNLITKDLVKQIHKQHKTINAWTPNTEKEIQDMLNLHVDNIITDNVNLAKKVLNRR